MFRFVRFSALNMALCYGAARVDFLPQLAHVHVDDIGLRVEMVIPHVFQQHGARDHLVGVAHQVGEQLEFARLQHHRFAGPRHLVRQQVHAEVGHGERGFRVRVLRAAQQRVEARQQFAERERLHQVIVAAAFQATDALVHVAQRADDEDGDPVARLAQRFDDGQAIDAAGQHAVHDDGVIRFAGGQEHAFAAIVRAVDRVPGFDQPLLDEQRHPFVVFHQ